MKFASLVLFLSFTSCLSSTNLLAVDVTLGTWLEEDTPGVGSVTGSGDSFTAQPGNNPLEFTDRQKVYQLFAADEKVDFSSNGQSISIAFDVVFNARPKENDSDFRFSFIDTSTNQGFYPVSWDLGVRKGTYQRARFVDNLDGDPSDGFDAWGGAVVDALNGSGTIADTSEAPVVSGAGEELGLTVGNTVHFEATITRNADDSFSFTADASEDDGLVVYPTVSGTYNPVTNASSPKQGDSETSNQAIDQFDGIVFGMNDSTPFFRDGDFDDDQDVDGTDFLQWQQDFPELDASDLADWQTNYGSDPAETYTVSNIAISATAFVPVPSLASLPEPTSLALLMISAMAILARRV